LIDILGALLGLTLLSPLFALIWVLIRFRMGSPVLFRQIRPGKNEVPFEMLKFRTMRDVNGQDGNPLPDAQRLTRLGKILRSTSLDELPELWNVLKGQMSLVGPRPLLMEYLPLYSEQQNRRHSVRPGITGWAQINGRNAISWEEKFQLDVWYVDNISIFLDLKILILTMRKVILRDGITPHNSDKIPRFAGSSSGSASND